MNYFNNLYRFFLILVIISSSILYYSCNGDKKDNSNQLVIGYMPIAECLPLFIAIENNYFSDEELDIRIVQFSGGAHSLEALGAKSIDIAFSNLVSLIYAKSGGKDFISIWGATIEDSSHILHGLVSIDKNINVPKDLIKKTIAVNTIRNIDDLLLTKWLRKYKIDKVNDKIKIVEVPFPRMPSVLKNGDVNAIAVVEPFLTAMLTEYSGKSIGDYFLSDRNRITITSYCSSKNRMLNNQNKFDKFKKAMNKAVDYYINNPQKSRELLIKYTKIPERFIRKINLPIFEKSITDTNDLRYLINTMKDFNLLKKNIFCKDLL